MTKLQAGTPLTALLMSPWLDELEQLVGTAPGALSSEDLVTRYSRIYGMMNEFYSALGADDALPDDAVIALSALIDVVVDWLDNAVDSCLTDIYADLPATPAQRSYGMIRGLCTRVGDTTVRG